MGWRVPIGAGDLPGGEETGECVFLYGELAVQHADVDVLALAADGALDQGGEDANGAVESAGNVADGGAGPDGGTAGLAGDAHDAAHALDDDVECGQVGVGARLSQSRRSSSR